MKPRSLTLSRTILFAYSLFIVYGTTIPFRFDFRMDLLREGLATLLADPFQLNRPEGFSLPDIVSNLLFFAPFGIILSWILLERARSSWFSVLVATAAFASLLSSGVEFLQLFESSRTTSLLDVAVNTSGAVLGAILGLALVSTYRLGLRDFVQSHLQDDPRRILFGFYAALLLVWKLTPFDVSLDVSTLKHAVRSIDLSLPSSMTAFAEVAPDAILFAAFAFLWLGTRWGNANLRHLSAAVVWTALFATGIELTQLLVVSHTTKWVDVVAGVAGGVYGAALFAVAGGSRTIQARGTRLMDLGLAHWLVCMLLVGLYPFDFRFPAPAPLQFAWLPYVEYYQRTGPAAIADLVDGLFRFGLLTMLVLERRYRRGRQMNVWTVAALSLIAIGFTLLVEGAQLFLPSRYSGVTDCVNALAGVLVGSWSWQRLSGVMGRDDRFAKRRIHPHSADPRRRLGSAQVIEARRGRHVPRRPPGS